MENIRQAAEAGYDEVYVQQIGPEQEAFFRFYEREVLPRLQQLCDTKESRGPSTPHGPG